MEADILVAKALLSLVDDLFVLVIVFTRSFYLARFALRLWVVKLFFRIKNQ
ncbi:hypothetical protein BGZ67_004932 [Mortierella alpina]|nr:hypothetical protein BGZ67_004932 [Mortierella alpina]